MHHAVRGLRVQSTFGYACVLLAAYEAGTFPAELTGDVLTVEVVDACCGLLHAPSTPTSTGSPEAA